MRSPVKTIQKPWGREIWFANLAGYVGKILEVKKGKRLSLQYHEQKTETQYVYSGKIKLTVGTDQKSLKEVTLSAGDKWDILPYTIHRIEGLEDSQVFEVSTSQLEDVVRLADDFGRPQKGNDEALDKKLHNTRE